MDKYPEFTDSRACAAKASPFWLSPKRGSITFYRALTEHAVVFLAAAKRDIRWPKSDCPTNEGKRIRFLARAMAGGWGSAFERRKIYFQERRKSDWKRFIAQCANAVTGSVIIKIEAIVNIAFAHTFGNPEGGNESVDVRLSTKHLLDDARLFSGLGNRRSWKCANHK